MPDGDCCHGCRFANARNACRTAGSTCDLTEMCSGFSADCPADAVKPPDTPCEDGDLCTVAEVCKTGTCTRVRICQADLGRKEVDVQANELVADLP